MRTIWIMCGAFAISACGKSNGSAERNRPVAAPPTFEAQLRELKAPARGLAFRNAIRDAGLRCDRVEKSHYQQSLENAGMWVAHCSDNGDIALFVGPTGFVQVRRCQDLKVAEVPQCKTAAS
jgi:hypothetical protein